MNAIRRRLRHGDPEAGSVTVFAAISLLGILVLIGLVADGGVKLRAVQRADAAAAEAARAGGQAIDLAAAVEGDTARVDPGPAARAAQAYLASAGVSGDVTVSGDRTRLVVTVTEHAPTVFLGLIGIDEVSATGSAEAVLVRGVSTGGES